ncbi:PhoX family protein [Marinimicrobium alkaliphilum]|uniref:PhoX family protein n=1 Tax=Marinimicrobium alkaliphilum TaxID=2202654 RepID=UPI0018E0B85E|nr:PhoX family phosphatase [Marinimicrobium alkaliphilum]
MITEQESTVLVGDEGDEQMSNLSSNTAMRDVIRSRYSRRSLLQGSLSAAALGFLGAGLVGCGSSSSDDTPPGGDNGNGNGGANGNGEIEAPVLLGFAAIPVSDADTVVVPEGYSVRAILPMGEPIAGSYPSYALDNSGEEQGMQMGSHHDGMHFFPIEGEHPYEGSSAEGFIVMNHEYVEPRFMHTAAIGQALSRSNVPVLNEDNERDADQVLKELNGHGVSIVRMREEERGHWVVVADDRNRRVTGLTPMEISGPVRGTDFVKTRFSPTGTMTRGTLNNCAHGVTPWNTYLAAEENWAGYFRNSTAADRDALPREQSRYGVRHAGQTSRYLWDQANEDPDLHQQRFARFDVGATGDSALEDYRNEPNGFGWMVEIDPFDETHTPVKRTALGRFAHEGVVFANVEEGKPVVCYSGDDAQNEYIYKFVSAQPYYADTAGGHLLDTGTLYVARFNEDGSGEWLPLIYGMAPLNDANGFRSQADVLVNTRLAADALGATKMDRPEWGAVNPLTGSVYFTLTNNTSRTDDNTDAANPRAQSRWGHIIRWDEANGNAAGTRFEWDIFILAGPTDDSAFNGEALTDEQIFNSPDGLWFDKEARLWIQTDISEGVMNSGDWAQFGNNQMLACDPINKVLRRFLTGPLGQEITGVVTTPDQRTMFVNVQHPGATTTPADFAEGDINSRFPDYDNAIYPRSATLVITKDDGGVIGS